MKQFISSKLFLALQEVSQSGIDEDTNVLKNRYDEFVMLLLLKGGAFPNKVTYYNKLIYTRVELAYLTVVSKKKSSNLFR